MYYMSMGWRDERGTQVEFTTNVGEEPDDEELCDVASSMYESLEHAVNDMFFPPTAPLYDPNTGELIPPQTRGDDNVEER